MKVDNADVKNLMKNIDEGKIQLPEFQRDWVWNDDKIKKLLASVLSDYPIGALMFLACGQPDNVNFSYRPIEGAPSMPDKVEELVLDGQQRLTTLYSSMYSNKPVKINVGKNTSEYLYFINIEKAVNVKDGDLSDAVESFRMTKTNLVYKEPAKQFESKLFPLNIVFNSTKKLQWQTKYFAHYNQDDTVIDEYTNFLENIIDKLLSYKIPVIMLEKDTNLVSVCRMFESINEVGVKLSEFDLLTAKFSKDKFNLREDWQKVKNKKPFDEENVLSVVDDVTFLTACTLFSSYSKSKLDNNVIVSCSKADVLNLKLDDYKNCRDKVRAGFIAAKNFLADEKIFRSADLPYKTQLIPLSVLWALIKKTSLDNAAAKNKIRQWYWCGVFGEVYNNAANSDRFSSDVTGVMDWINGGDVPKIVKEVEFNPARLLTRSTSAVYKGILALILQNNCQDFIGGDNMGNAFFNDKSVEIHHIFPKKYCLTKKLDKEKWDSALNKTPLRDTTNKALGGYSPSNYIETINLDEETLTEILKSNWIDIDDLRKDDFDSFIVHRAKKILDVIEKICGKKFGHADAEVITKFGQSLE